MPLSSKDFEDQGVFGFSDAFRKLQEKISDVGCYAAEPTSVLDGVRSPSPLAATSSSTYSATGDANPTHPEPKCTQMGPQVWETVLTEQDSVAFNKTSNSLQDSSFCPFGFGVFDPGLGFESLPANDAVGNFLFYPQSAIHDQIVESQILNPPFVINHNQNQSLFPTQPRHFQEDYPSPPPAKRLNLVQCHAGLETDLPDPLASRIDDQSSIAVAQQLFKAAELIGCGGIVTAQGILARLNQHLSSPMGRPPFQRAAFYFSQALQLLLLRISSASNPSSHSSDPFNLVFKIAAYKSFSEVSPVLHFTNFTANQSMIEVFQGFDNIHIVDFDVGYGGQWASLMQELCMRTGKKPCLKITVVSCPTNHDELQLRFTAENLRSFAGGLNIQFELEIVGLDFLHSLPHRSSGKRAIGVNLPISSVSDRELSLILRSIEQISPDIVVSTEGESDRTDSAMPHRIILSLSTFYALLDSLDAVNMNPEALHKIEKFLIQPGIEKAVTKRVRTNDRLFAWKPVLMHMGFSPLKISNLTEAQAECLVQRTPIRGFHVEKRQCSSLSLLWQGQELVSVSAWTSTTFPGRY